MLNSKAIPKAETLLAGDLDKKLTLSPILTLSLSVICFSILQVIEKPSDKPRLNSPIKMSESLYL